MAGFFFDLTSAPLTLLRGGLQESLRFRPSAALTEAVGDPAGTFFIFRVFKRFRHRVQDISFRYGPESDASAEPFCPFGYRFLLRCPQAKRIAVAFAEQEVDEVVTDEYDLPMDAVITDR